MTTVPLAQYRLPLDTIAARRDPISSGVGGRVIAPLTLVGKTPASIGLTGVLTLSNEKPSSFSRNPTHHERSDMSQ